MSEPVSQVIARRGRGTADSRRQDDGAASWGELTELLRTGPGTTWLSVRHGRGGVHTRPVFAAWGGESFVFATNGRAAKTAHLRVDASISLAVDLGSAHLVAEGTARRLRQETELLDASRAMLEVYEWPTEVVGEELDAPYAAPSSGGPPFEAWGLAPRRVLAFPTEDQFEPTRFVFAR